MTVTAGDALLAPTVTGRLIQEYVSAPPPGEPVEVREMLTEREREVFDPVVRGLSNAEIGRRLYLGEPTVKTHVARAFAKLGLRDRVQAVIFVYETGCIRPGQAPV